VPKLYIMGFRRLETFALKESKDEADTQRREAVEQKNVAMEQKNTAFANLRDGDERNRKNIRYRTVPEIDIGYAGSLQNRCQED
jgi:hypothetical protein